jgi:hypothetical protein
MASALPLFADNWWIETTHEDFADGDYAASLYAADSGALDNGSVQMIHYRDIDEDGNLDLLISNNRSGSVTASGPAYYAYHYDNLAFVDSLFSHNGSGNLIVDYDNDGNLDIILSAYDSANVTNLYSRIYYGPGFSPAQADSFATNQAMAVSAADIDKDGKLDLVFSNYAGGNAAIYYQGNPTPQTLNCTGNLSNAVADLDKDGDLDIVLAGMSALVFYGPSFTSPTTITGMDSLTDVAIADLDNDSTLDIVFSAMGDKSYIVYGPDYSSFDEEVDTRNARAVSVADVGATDDELDLVFSNWFDPDSGFAISSIIYYGPDYTAGAPTRLETHGSVGNVIGDFDDDRTLDIFFSNWATVDSVFDTLSFIYFGPDFTTSDTLITIGAHMSTATDPGNVYDRSGQEVYLSTIHDAADTVEWDSVSLAATVPAGSSLALEVQTGNVALPDTSWSDWLVVADGDTLPDDMAGRYIHYRATFTFDFLQAPMLQEVGFSYPAEKDVGVDSIISPNPEDVGHCATRAFLFQVRNLGNAPETFPVHCILDSLGTIIFDSTMLAEDVAPGDSALMLFGGVYCCPGETLWVITELVGDAVPENDTLMAHLGPTAVAESPQIYELELVVSPAPRGYSIGYALSSDEKIALAVYDVTGRTVITLDEGTRRAGRHLVAWDGHDAKGRTVPAGIYFIRLETKQINLSRKIVVVE